jgi:hypothetical protein
VRLLVNSLGHADAEGHGVNFTFTVSGKVGINEQCPDNSGKSLMFTAISDGPLKGNFKNARALLFFGQAAWTTFR